ncbi:unnamed protein product, partial [Mesorhabditis belari]|uniref:Uncharacterized protein n=1 Tax=Mesorhabditis belari TaxID=2138241 RepID=A0AAF3EYA4_9BILA
MIDCHAHLVDKKFKNDIDEVIEKAKEARVSKVVVVPEWPSQFDAVFELFARHPDFIVPSLGLHPIRKNHKGVNREELKELEAALEKYKGLVKCIGEVGLDYTVTLWKIDEDSMQAMRDVLKEETRLALLYDLPMTVHSRTAHKETIALLIENGAKRVAMHAFGGTPEEAKHGVEHGFYFSIPPSFSINDQGAALVASIPLENLLLETDSPVLGPVKGERNVPANLIASAKFIAKVKNLSEINVIEATSANARKLFRL